MKRTIASVLITAMVCLSACSNSNVTKGKNYDDMQEVKAESVNVDQEQDYHKIGETFQVMAPVYQQPDEVQSEITVLNATIYDNMELAGIDKEKMPERGAVYKGLDPTCPESIMKDVLYNGKVLVCEVKVKNISEDTPNIAGYDLAYKKDNGELEVMSYCTYFSDSNDVNVHYTAYNLPKGQTKNISLAWCVDENIIELPEIKKENLYIVYGIDSEDAYREVVKLDLE